MAALSALVRARLVEAIDGGMCSAAALALVRSAGNVRTVAVGRTSRVRQRKDGLAPRLRLEPAPGVPIDERTPFDLASLTKPVCTTTLLAQAVGRGDLDLRMPLGACLPDAVGHPIGAVELRHLVGHTSGWPAWVDFFAATAAIGDPAERAATVRAKVLATALQQQPGTAAVYSDLGFMALGWALERSGGAPLDVLFAHQVAAPLAVPLGFAPLQSPPWAGAVATEIWDPRCPSGRALQGAVHDDNCAALGGVAGHAGLFGSATDVGRWAASWLMALGDGCNPLGLAGALVREWVAAPVASGSSWRLGFDTPTPPGSTAGDNAPNDTFGHLGFTGTSVWLAPSVDAAVVLLTNRVHPTRDGKAGIQRLRNELHQLIWQALRNYAEW